MWTAWLAGLGIWAGIAGLALCSPLSVDVAIRPDRGRHRLDVRVSFWRWRRGHTWFLDLHPPAVGRSGRSPRRWDPAAACKGFHTYLVIVGAMAARARMDRGFIHARMSAGDAASTALSVGCLQAVLAAALPHRVRGAVGWEVVPDWGPAALTVDAQGIFHWQAAHIMGAVGQGLRT
jgi:hypothetical protein